MCGWSSVACLLFPTNKRVLFSLFSVLRFIYFPCEGLWYSSTPLIGPYVGPLQYEKHLSRYRDIHFKHKTIVSTIWSLWWTSIYWEICPKLILTVKFNGLNPKGIFPQVFAIIPDIAFCYRLNTLRPRQNGRHFTDDTFNRIFLNENVWIPIKISLKFVPKCPINNIPSLIQIMAWRRPGNKPLSEPVVVSLLTHICFTRPQ